MAPLPFGDTINLVSMVGTWLGTLFTLIGLAALITQLRALLKDFSNDRKEIIKAAAGDWAICLPTLRRQDVGILEGKAPSLRGWVYTKYHENQNIAICPYTTNGGGRAASGDASWSQLFRRLEILPQDILDPRQGHLITRQKHADVLIEGTKVSYGLPSEDFIALMILSGDSPSSFSVENTSMASSHLGHMYLASHVDPFSHVAQLDGFSYNIQATEQGTVWKGRYADRINVRHCIDVALGILRFDCAGKASTLLFGTATEDDEDHPFSANHPPWPRPSKPQQLMIRRSLTELSGGSMVYDALYDIRANAYPDVRKHFGGHRFAWRAVPFDAGLTADQVNYMFEVAFGIRALRPWGALVVLPKSMVRAFCPFLDLFLDSQPQDSPWEPVLIGKFYALPANVPHQVPHRTRTGMKAALDSLQYVRTRNFSGLSAHCSLYFDAMMYVLLNNGITLEQVEIALAAHCAVKYAIEMALAGEKGLTEAQIERIKAPEWQVGFRAFLRECINGEPIDDVEPWACEILATFIYAWLQESKDISLDFRKNFRRRVFLG